MRFCKDFRLSVEELEPRIVLSFTVYDQLLLELVNYSRANPQAEANRLLGGNLNQGLAPGTISSTPKQPLAHDPSLYAAAQVHTDRMLAFDFFDHTDPINGSTPGSRADDAGYNWNGIGENIAFRARTTPINQEAEVIQANDDLFESPGHRQNILDPAFEELGTATEVGSFRYEGVTYNHTLMVSQLFGRINGAGPFLTGVVIQDTDGDQRYDINEGLGSVTITATGAAGTFQTTSLATGGYQLELPTGTYTITAAGNGVAQEFQVSIGSQNLKLDILRNSNNEAYVEELYLDILRRAADQGGKNYWTGQLNLGAARLEVATALMASDEYRGHIVSDLFWAFLERAPDPGGLDSFVTFLRNGGKVENAAAIIVGSTEYFQKNSSDLDLFLEDMYLDGLGRPIDETGRQDFTNLINGGLPHADAAAILFASTEFQHKLVNEFYTDILHRPVDETGLDYFGGLLAQGNARDVVAALLYASDEYLFTFS